MSDVLLGHSYFPSFDPKAGEARQPYPPLGTLYAAGYLRARGYDVAAFDAMLAESEAEWAAALEREAPRFAVLYEDSFNYLSKMCLLRMREAAYSMIDMARARGYTVIACGSDATDRAPDYLARGAAFVLVGEGEETLGELLDMLTGRSATALSEIRGLVYADPGRRGSTIRTAPRPVMRDLDALPPPARDLVDIEAYRALWMREHGYFSLNVATTRGCPFHCNWCAKPIWGQRYNVRAPESVVAELRHLREAYRPDHIWFADDILGLKPGWLARFAELIEAEGVRIPFKCLSRADLLLRDGDIEALARAGCGIVWIGAESGSQKVLDAMEKGTRVEQIREASRRLRAAGVQVGFFLQFGYPGETREDIELTFQLVRDCRPDDIGVSVSYPLPGTRFHREVEAQLGGRENWVDSGDLAMLFQGPYPTAFYRRLHTVLHREFRMRRSWSALRDRRPGAAGFRRTMRDAATVVLHAAALPVDRLRLERLARAPHEPSVLAAGVLAPAEAARPSPQNE